MPFSLYSAALQRPRGPPCCSRVLLGCSEAPPAFPHYTTESLLVILILTHQFTHLYVHISGPQAAEFLKKGTPHSSQSDRHPPWKSQSPWQWECEETDKTELDFSEVRARSRHLLSRHPHILHSQIHQENLGGRNKTCQNQRVPGRVRLNVEI